MILKIVVQNSDDIILNVIKEIDVKGIFIYFNYVIKEIDIKGIQFIYFYFILFFYFFSYIIVVRIFVKTVMILF
jgi:hypothetical protein